MTAIKPGRKVLHRAVRTNLLALKARVKLRGMFAIDKRTHAARGLLRWKEQIIFDLGGSEAVSAQRMALIDMAVRTRLFIEHCDAWLMEQKSLINAKEKGAIPLLLQRQALVDSLCKILKHLGLDRRERSGKTISLREYWEQPVVESEEHGEESSSAR